MIVYVEKHINDASSRKEVQSFNGLLSKSFEFSE